MITAIHLSETASKPADIDALPKTGVNWVDCNSPAGSDLTVLEKLFKFSHIDLGNALDETERARLVERAGYDCLLFKAPLLGKESLKALTVGIFIRGNSIVTLHRQAIPSFESLQKKQSPASNGPQLILTLLRNIIDSYFTDLEKIEETVSGIEGRALRPKSNTVVKEIFATKKMLIYFHKALLSDREALSQLTSGKAVIIPKGYANDLAELHNDLLQLLDISSVQMDMISNTIDIYMSSISNSMNSIVKQLTIMASFTMIPTLIASIYGMNFGQDRVAPGLLNMPELNWYIGYPFALTLMAVSVIGMAWYFRWKKWW